MAVKHREPPAGQPASTAEGPQEAVARARAHVLSGRGQGADKAETDRYKRERPTLGPLPAPLARELVHLDTARIRSGHAGDVDDVAIQNQIDRTREVWAPRPDATTGPPATSWRCRGAALLASVCGMAVGAMAARRRYACGARPSGVVRR